MKIRVLQLIGSFHLGGSERQAVELTKRLQEDDNLDVLVATMNNDGVLRSELRDLQIPEYKLTSFYNLDLIRKVRQCAAFIRQNKVDVVHTHDFYTNVFGMAAATLAGTRAMVASKRETAGMRSRGQDLVEGLAFRRANAVVSNSLAVSELLVRRGVPPAKIRTIYNSVDASEFITVSLNPGFALPVGKRFVTMVANLRHEVKNVPMFLRTAKRVIDNVSDAHFVIAGEGELETSLRKMAFELGIEENVTFTGRCDDVPALLNASFACVLTSNAEGFSNSILEYMAAGKPVVATSVGGADEAIVNGETGYLVGPDDDAQMAEHLVDMFSNEKKAAELGRAGRERVAESFSPEQQIQQTIELYTSLIFRS